TRLDKLAGQPEHKLLEFTFLADNEVMNSRFLTDIHGLFVCLSNLTIDPIRKTDKKCKSRINAYRFRTQKGEERLGLRLLTSFANTARTQLRWSEGRSATAERRLLREFGVEFDPEWQDPSQD